MVSAGIFILLIVVASSYDTYTDYYPSLGDSNYPWWSYSGFWIAIFTLVLTGSTIGLWLATSQQARITRDSIELARNEFIATHRPKLRVRNVSLDQGWISRSYSGGSLKVMKAGEQVSGSLYVANIGGTLAEIISSHCEIFWSNQGIPGQRLYEETPPSNFIKGRINPGGFEKGEFKSAPLSILPMTSGMFETTGFGKDETRVKAIVIYPRGVDDKLYILGKILYQDRRGVAHETAFCRLYDGSEDRFAPVNNPDYEYEE